MQERSLAEAVVAAAREQAARHRMKRVSLMKVGIGELHGADRAVLESALEELLRQERPPLAEARARLEIERAAFRCRLCRREWRPEPALRKRDTEETEAVRLLPEAVFAFLRCPGCSSPDFEILGGRGIRIESLEGEH